MSRRVRVHHFVANLLTQQYGPHPTSNLLGVDYIYDVPADTEFPRRLGQIDLFTRFYLTRATPVTFFARIWWMDAPRRKQGRMIGQFGPFPVDFDPVETVRDHSFRVSNLQLAGVGRYTVRLVRPRTSEWKSGKFAVVAETHFFVER